MGLYSIYLFVAGLFNLAWYPQSSSILWHVTGFPSFLRLIFHCMWYAIFYLFMHQWTLGLLLPPELWILLLWTWVCKYTNFLKSIFNWRIIALQYCVGFCHTSAWISLRHTYVPSLLNLPSTSHPILPLKTPQTTSLNSLSITAIFHWLSILHTVVYILSY